MKAVLISIQPKLCELIASGKKTVEVRKTKPKLETPFKCYIYCTKAKQRFTHGGIVETLDDLFCMPNGQIKYGYSGELMCCDEPYSKDNFLNGKVIGEFVCDKILFANGTNFVVEEDAEITLQGTCLTKDDIYKRLGIKSGMSRYDKKTEFYRWHISDLVIYDKPKELSEFYRYCGDNPDCDGCRPLKRPPQSWCYAEGKEDEGNEQKTT